MYTNRKARPKSTSAVQTAVLAFLIVAALSGCGATVTTEPTTDNLLVEVPQDAATIEDAVEKVAPGGMVLISAGTYFESVTVDKENVTIRGVDRNSVIIDGEGLRANGVQVIADGVRVQNLTVVNHTFNGVLVTGLHDANGAQAHNLDGYSTLDPEEFPPLQRFEVSHVTASNNGLYGIYAFNSQHGVISDNYASGSADSGFYVGQCEECDILVSGNIAEHNAIGYENANASDSVVVTENRFTNNRVGLTLLSWYQEAYLPQKSAAVVGNVISDNASADSPAQANGAFGIGIGLSGANTNVIARNLVSNNPAAGVQITNTEDLSTSGNRLTDNVFDANGVDVTDLSAQRAAAFDNCVVGDDTTTFLPESLGDACGESSTATDTDGVLSLTVPPGVSFLQIERGPDQPTMAGDLSEVPPLLATATEMPDLESIDVPDYSLLDEWTRG